MCSVLPTNVLTMKTLDTYYSISLLNLNTWIYVIGDCLFVLFNCIAKISTTCVAIGQSKINPSSPKIVSHMLV